MIKEIKTTEEISGDISPLLPRIFVAFKYKTGSDNAWRQIDENGNTTALLSSVSGNFTLVASAKTDFEEIKEFLEFFGCVSLVSNVPVSARSEKYTLFKVCMNENTEYNSQFTVLSKASTVKEYKKLHSLLFCDTESDFDLWYSDFSRKIVNNDAVAVALNDENGSFISIAVAPMIYKNTAVISGVFTAEDFRKNGFSKATIYKLAEELKKDNITDIFLWCEKAVEQFYEKTGFQRIGCIYMETEQKNELFQF